MDFHSVVANLIMEAKWQPKTHVNTVACSCLLLDSVQILPTAPLIVPLLFCCRL